MSVSASLIYVSLYGQSRTYDADVLPIFVDTYFRDRTYDPDVQTYFLVTLLLFLILMFPEGEVSHPGGTAIPG